MTPRQYKAFERTVKWSIMTIFFSIEAAVLLGVYALADLVF